MRKRRKLRFHSKLGRELARSLDNSSEVLRILRKLKVHYEKDFRDRCDLGDYKMAELSRIQRNCVRGIEDIFDIPPSFVRRTKFIFDSSFLHVLLYILVDGPNESMTYLSGPRMKNLAIPTSAITPQMRVRSVGYVEAEAASTYRVMKFLSNTGHSLLGQVHLHPGSGPSAVCPSPLDLKTHRDLISCYNMVDVIMARDGHFCIYREKPDYAIEFFGKGVRKIDRRIWKLEDIGPLF